MMPETMSAPTASAVAGEIDGDAYTSTAHVSTVSVRSVSAKTCAYAETRLSSLLALSSMPSPSAAASAAAGSALYGVTRHSGDPGCALDAWTCASDTSVGNLRRLRRRTTCRTKGAHMKKSTNRLTIVKPSMIAGSTSSSSSPPYTRSTASCATKTVTAKSAITEKAEAPSSAACAPRGPQRARWCSATSETRYVTESTNIVDVSLNIASELANVAPTTCADVKTVLPTKASQSGRVRSSQRMRQKRQYMVSCAPIAARIFVPSGE